MIVVTSISPKHSNKDNQFNAIESWRKFGKCYSLNNKNEIEKIKSEYDNIAFIETDRTVQALIGKPLVNINAFFDFSKVAGQSLLLTNSDIIITHLPELKEDGITLFSRYDYTDNIEDNKLFEAGFDVFYIPHNFLHIFPPSIYSLGCAWHDYFTPLRAIMNNIPIYYPQGKYAFHKLHPTQYSYDEWAHIGEYFRLDFRYKKEMTVPQIATKALSIIKNHFK